MSISIQTNTSSLIAQENLAINTRFQNQTIQRLTSGYRINSSGDDAAGLAIANKYRGDTAELTQGARNANDGISALQIIDGGLNNIGQIFDRLRTLATQSASTTFTGDRSTLNNEYQSLLGEINRQASNVGLNTNGTYNTQINVYVGGGSTQANAQVSIDLSGANNRVDSSGLGISTTSIAGGGTALSGNTVRLDDTASTFVTSATQNFTFHLSTANANTDVTVAVTGGSGGLSGTQVISSLNSQLSSYGISASIGSTGTLQFGGPTAFTVTTTGAATGAVANTSATGTAVNVGNANLASGAFAAFVSGAGTNTSTSETVVFQNGSGSYSATLDGTNAATLTAALATLNTALTGSGINAVKDAAGTSISFQSAASFSAVETGFTASAGTGTGNLFGSVGAKAVTAAAAGASSTGTALAALTTLGTAVTAFNLVQGRVGTGQNKLQFAINLAQSQISSFSAAQSRIRDADVAAEAANLTKAQVLQSASIAALAQANSAPQAVLKLLQ
jgi:flagellin